MEQGIANQKAPRSILFACLAMMLVATTVQGSLTSTTPYHLVDRCAVVEALQFDGQAANASVQWQVDLGPRLPGSNVSESFRETISDDLTALGYEVTQQQHQRYDMNLTNVFATWTPNGTSTGTLVLSAHYDSRNIADQDENQSNRSLPVPGANDAASGVAVLLELAKHIPSMGLDHEVVLFFNDAEDQDQQYTLGAEAWAENLTEDEIASMHAFVLLDMVGDADLQLHNVLPGNDTLKSRVVELGTDLGLVNGTVDCHGATGIDVVQYDLLVGVLDDHVHADALGIPSIDIMDTSYGEPKPYTFGSYWHTMEDTPDKVSAESLGAVGRLVELGLRTQAFVNLEGDIEGDDKTPTQTDSGTDVQPQDATGSKTLATLAAIGLFAVLGFILLVEWKGKR